MTIKASNPKEDRSGNHSVARIRNRPSFDFTCHHLSQESWQLLACFSSVLDVDLEHSPAHRSEIEICLWGEFHLDFLNLFYEECLLYQRKSVIHGTNTGQLLVDSVLFQVAMSRSHLFQLCHRGMLTAWEYFCPYKLLFYTLYHFLFGNKSFSSDLYFAETNTLLVSVKCFSERNKCSTKLCLCR